MKTIEVKSCLECPFKTQQNKVQTYSEYCLLDKNICSDIWMPRLSVHQNCPLKTESVTVKLKDYPNNN